MTADDFDRPAPAGRVFWCAIAASLLVHALLIPVTAGHGGDNGWPAAGALQPKPVLTAPLAGDHADALAVAGATRDSTTAIETNSSSSNAQPGNSVGNMIGFAAATRYYPARELDIRPQIRSQVEPAYPRQAFEQGQPGMARLRILINAQGKVDDVIAQGRDGTDAFTAAAVTAFRAASYTPGIKNGVPVPSEVMIEVQFESFTAADTFRGSSY